MEQMYVPVNNEYLKMKEDDFNNGNAIYMDGEVTRESINYWTMQLRKLANQELDNIQNGRETSPINMYISSYGGSLVHGFYMVNLMEYYIKRGVEIHTYANGFVASMGSKILISGSKRFGFKNSKVLFHQYNKPVNGTLTHRDIEIMYKDGVKTMKEIEKLIFSKTNIPKNLFRKSIRENDDLILNADECLKYKVFDEILE